MSTSDSWSRTWRDLGAKGDGGAVYRMLRSLYSDPARHYHTLEHIETCLWEFDVARDLADHPSEVEFALWFHDAVHETREIDNEERSAELAEQVLHDAGVGHAARDRVRAMILATAHEERPRTVDGCLTVDADLTILGQPLPDFDAYETGVRREYAWVPDTAFRAGRAGMLRGLLARDAIYRTDHFRERYEEKARANVRRSLDRLTHPPDA